jgi:hypothetical protein
MVRSIALLLCSTVLLAGPLCARLYADGGQVRAMERHGDYQITVFTSPTPLRAGTVDVSVLVQDATSGRAISDGRIAVELTPHDGTHPAIRATATTAEATNKLLRAAIVELPTPGSWNAQVEFKPADSKSAPYVLSFPFDAAPPLPAWLTVWPWFCWPIVVVLLFIVHRVRVARHHSRLSRQRSAAPKPLRAVAEFAA